MPGLARAAAQLSSFIGVQPVRTLLWSWHPLVWTLVASGACTTRCRPQGCKLSRRTSPWGCSIWTVVPFRAYCTRYVSFSTIESLVTRDWHLCLVFTLIALWADGALGLGRTVCIVPCLTWPRLFSGRWAVIPSRAFLTTKFTRLKSKKILLHSFSGQLNSVCSHCHYCQGQQKQCNPLHRGG